MLLAIVIAIVVIALVAALVVGVVRRRRRNDPYRRSTTGRYLDRVAAQARAEGGKHAQSDGYEKIPASARYPGGGGPGGG